MVCRVHPRHRTEERPIAQHWYLAEDGYLAEEIIRSDGPRALLKPAADRSSRMRDCAWLPLHGGGPTDPPDPDLISLVQIEVWPEIGAGTALERPGWLGGVSGDRGDWGRVSFDRRDRSTRSFRARSSASSKSWPPGP